MATMKTGNTAYDEASTAYSEAFKTMAEYTVQFRAGRISTEDYCRARKILDDASLAFDKAEAELMSDKLCSCEDIFSCPHGGRIDEIEAQRETGERKQKLRMARRKR